MSEGAKLRKSRAQDEREARARKLRELLELLIAAHEKRASILAGVNAACRERRRELAEASAKLRAELHRVAEAKRERAASCKLQRSDVPAREREDAARKLRDEREHVRALGLHARKRESFGGPSVASGGGRRAAERRSESDDAVRGNIDPRLVPVFDKARRTIKASERHSRTEAFEQWAAEHPGEVAAILEAAAAVELVKQERAERRAQRERRAAAVPF